jgi:ribose 5-phosphate isomerase B
MRLLFASDHGGFDLKRLLAAHARSLGHEVIDVGPHAADAVDYPDFAHELCRRLLTGEGERGVLLCGTGIGMAIAANRHAGVRAALCHDAFTAETARRHNDANVLCLGGRSTGAGVALQILELFLTVAFDGGRHVRRIEKVESLNGSARRDTDSDVVVLRRPRE